MRPLKYGFVVPHASERDFADIARQAEARGWDAIFTWETVWGRDAWATLAAAAMTTERIRLGTLLTPASRYRPWDLAARVGSVDRLSGGRVTVSVGLGAVMPSWTAFEADEGRAVRAQKLDEGLEIFRQLSSTGSPQAFEGEHWQVRPPAGDGPFAPLPSTQQPHPPIWSVAHYVPGRAQQRSLERAARWNGALPSTTGDGEHSHLSIDTMGTIIERLRALRSDAGLPWEGYDVVAEGDTFGNFGEIHGPVEPWANAGATWWVESWWDLEDNDAARDELRRRVDEGPRR